MTLSEPLKGKIIKQSVSTILDILIDIPVKILNVSFHSYRRNEKMLPNLHLDIILDSDDNKIVLDSTIGIETICDISLLNVIIITINKCVTEVNNLEDRLIETTMDVINNYPIKLKAIRKADKQSRYISDMLLTGINEKGNEIDYPINSEMSLDRIHDNKLSEVRILNRINLELSK